MRQCSPGTPARSSGCDGGPSGGTSGALPVTASSGPERDGHVVARADELGPGDRVVTQLAGREVAVFNVDGELVAYPNWCPHQGGPLCEGDVGGTSEADFDRESLTTELRWVREGTVLRCPWHQWEFDLRENAFLHDADRSLPSYPVTVEDGDVVVRLG